jgi:hypothetical protein
MKNLELKSMGVQEMDAKEIKSVDGGLRIYIEGSIQDIYNSSYPKGERWFWQRDY